MLVIEWVRWPLSVLEFIASCVATFYIIKLYRVKGNTVCYTVAFLPASIATLLFSLSLIARTVYTWASCQCVFPYDPTPSPLAAAAANGIIIGWALTVTFIAISRLKYE